MNNNNFFDDAGHRGVDQTVGEIQELLPAILSRRAVDVPGAAAVRPTPVVVSAEIPGAAALPCDSERGCDPFLSARLWEEEAVTLSNGSVAEAYFCARLVVVNSRPRPVPARVDILGLPPAAAERSGVVVATRIFDAVYTVNLTQGTAAGIHMLDDYVDGWGTNVYEIGCVVPTTGAATNLAVNGNFETVTKSKPTQIYDSWHIFATDPVAPGSWDGGMNSGGTTLLSSENRTDDRARLTADTADPFEGRYSGRIVVPTATPLLIPISLTASPAVGLGRTVRVSFRARSSPAGAVVAAVSGPMPMASNAGAGSSPLPPLGPEWSLVGPFEVKLINSTAAAPRVVLSQIAPLREQTAPAPPVGARAWPSDTGNPLHLVVSSPHKTGGIVWVDDVVVMPAT